MSLILNFKSDTCTNMKLQRYYFSLMDGRFAGDNGAVRFDPNKIKPIPFDVSVG